MIYRFNFY